MQNTYLQHHGIKGQKWGVRRYQNPDGSLTTEGKLRYGQSAKKVYKKAEKILDIPENKWARYDAVSYVATDLNAFKKTDPNRKMTLNDLEVSLYFSATGKVGYDETINAFSIYANENGHANELKKMYDELNSIPGAKTKNGEWIENQGEIKLKYALQMSGVENKDGEKPTIGFDDTTKASISEAKKIVNNITDIENPQTSLVFWDAVENTGISEDKNLDDMSQADWDKINEEVRKINSTKNYIAHSDSYLEHHGIRGQKWGVRRFQNADGSLTPAGRRRYGEELDINDTSRTNVAKIRLGEARRRYDTAKKNNNNSELKSLRRKERKASRAVRLAKKNNDKSELKSLQKKEKEASRAVRLAKKNNNNSELKSLRKKEREASRAVRLAKKIDRGAELATKGETIKKNEAKATAEFLGIGFGTTLLGNALTNIAMLNEDDPKVFNAFRIGANIVHGSRWPLITLSTINRSHIEMGLRTYNEAIRSGRGTIKSIGGEEYRAVKKRKSMQHSYLEHHGVQGQKWGVRRFQNADGSLTPAGKIRSVFII